MSGKEIIDNSGLGIFDFYFEKFIFLGGAFISGLFCCLGYQEGESHWPLLGFLALILLFLADSIAMPIERAGNKVTFHHLWRESVLDASEVRFLWVSGGGRYKMHKKLGHQQLIALGKHPWIFYQVTCDKKNKLTDIFYDH